MKWIKAKDLFTGEYIASVRDDLSEDWFWHHYWKIIGHKHEEKKVLLESSYDNRKREIDYDTDVTIRPFGYKTLRQECLKEDLFRCYGMWPYDEKGIFCDPPRDYREWKKE